MKKIVKSVVAGMITVSAVLALASCGGNKAKVRYLNFKPEVSEIYQKLAEEYEKETGVKVVVETAANNQYESTLATKVIQRDAPTLFQINGPRGYAKWEKYCADLSNTELYKHLSDKSLAITKGNGVYGIPYVVEGYGIIYNKAITDKYFGLSSKKTSYKSMDEINSFAKLKELADDMQKNAKALGIKGVFASTSLAAGEDWRWQTHLANIPVYYEFRNNRVDLGSDATKKIAFQYSNEFKNIMDLYLNDSCTNRKDVGAKTVTDSMAEFALEDCAMVQNGNWAWGQIAGVDGNKVLPENVKYLPIYTGVEGEEAQGLCIGTENFFCINSQVSEEEQKATADFIYWLYSSETGKKYVTNELKFIAPFDTFAESERPTDPLAVEINNRISRPGITNVSWNFTLFPSQRFKDDFGSSFLRYAEGAKSWDEVSAEVVANWEKESNM